MSGIQNNQECFVMLWRKLRLTRRYLKLHYKRFCIRNVLRTWFEGEANDDFIWEVCRITIVDDVQASGWDELPPPSLYPRESRAFLRAVVAVKLGISWRKVNCKALDKAYCIVYPNSTPPNVRKQKRKRKIIRNNKNLQNGRNEYN